MRRSGTGVRNDPGQYDRLAGEWWRLRGAFARRRDSVRLRPTRSLASVYQGVRRKAS